MVTVIPLDVDSPLPMRRQAVGRGVEERVLASTATVEAIVAAAFRLLDRDRALDLNMRELVAEAGVSNRAFYRHFPTKEDLVATLVDEVYFTLVSSLADRAARAKGPVERLTAWIDGALDYATDAQLAARGRVFVVHEPRLRDEHRDLFHASGRALGAQVASIIEEGVEQGVFGTADPRAAARLVVRIVLASLEEHVLERKPPTAQERDALAAFVLGALR